MAQFSCTVSIEVLCVVAITLCAKFAMVVSSDAHAPPAVTTTAPKSEPSAAAQGGTTVPGHKMFGEKCAEKMKECDESLHLQCKGGQCDCVAGYASDMDKVCRMAYGESCNGTVGCAAGRQLMCNLTSSKCECKWPAEQIYEPKTMFCRAKVGSANCTSPETKWAEKCVEGASCEPGKETPPKNECKCKKGFKEVKGKLCSSAALILKSGFYMFVIFSAVLSISV